MLEQYQTQLEKLEEKIKNQIKWFDEAIEQVKNQNKRIDDVLHNNRKPGR